MLEMKTKFYATSFDQVVDHYTKMAIDERKQAEEAEQLRVEHKAGVNRVKVARLDGRAEAFEEIANVLANLEIKKV